MQQKAFVGSELVMECCFDYSWTFQNHFENDEDENVVDVVDVDVDVADNCHDEDDSNEDCSDSLKRRQLKHQQKVSGCDCFDCYCFEKSD